MKKKTTTDALDILAITAGRVSFCVRGLTPLLLHRLAVKAQRELLLPKGRKTAADKAGSLKHDPRQEFLDAAHMHTGTPEQLTALGVPTRLYMPAPAFKGALMTAALDLPGAKRTEIARLTWIPEMRVHVFGLPQLHMTGVKMQDIARTPDIRTRPILAEWAARVTVAFVEPKLSAQAVANLMAAAGITCGVGDFRQEKGRGNFGQFELVDEADADFRRIVATGGLAEQDAALARAEPYDADTAELLDWFDAEAGRRGLRVVGGREVA